MGDATSCHNTERARYWESDPREHSTRVLLSTGSIILFPADTDERTLIRWKFNDTTRGLPPWLSPKTVCALEDADLTVFGTPFLRVTPRGWAFGYTGLAHLLSEVAPWGDRETLARLVSRLSSPVDHDLELTTLALSHPREMSRAHQYWADGIAPHSSDEKWEHAIANLGSIPRIQ